MTPITSANYGLLTPSQVSSGFHATQDAPHMLLIRSLAIAATPRRALTRVGLVLALGLASIAPALAAPPSDADINRLLAASRAQTMLDSMLPQIEAMQRQQFQQVAQQRQLDAQQQEQMKRMEARTTQTIRQALSWQQLRPMYVDLYKKSFSKEDVLAMAEFYESSAGQSLLDKTPALMQNVMVAIQEKMQPLFVDLQKDLEAIMNEAPAPAPAKK